MPENEKSIQNLLHGTYSSLDNARVRLMFVATQTCNVDMKVEAAINEGIIIFRSGAFATSLPLPLMSVGTQATAGGLICHRFLKVFGYSQVNTDVLFQTIKNAWLGNLEANALQFVASLATSVLLGPVAWTTSAALAAFSVPKTARMLLMCVADVILILERAFWYEPGTVTGESIHNATLWYAGKMAAVHADVKNSIRWYSLIKSHQLGLIKADLEVIIQKHRFKTNEA